MRNTSNNKGITLISLVITIIILLILAGVSLNAIVGDNGLLKRTQEAKLTAEEAARREAVDLLILNYNTSKFLEEANGLGKYLEELVASGELNGFAATTDRDAALVDYQGSIYEVGRQSENSEYYKVIEKIPEDLGDINGNYILTQKTLDTEDQFAFENNRSYIVLDKNLTGDDFEFNIPDNSEVTIKALYDMTIDNEGVKRSAINLGNNATLNLYVYGKVTVNSGYSTQGATGEMGTMEQNKGGEGAYAGIHVPETATLNLYGTGTLIAYGGDASAGGAGTSDTLAQSGAGNGGGRRRWSRSWYWWKRW